MTIPILLLGAGRMGGAILDGWRRAGAFRPTDLMIRDPQPGPAALAAERGGAVLNPPDGELARAKTVLLCVKPQAWREVAAELAAGLARRGHDVTVFTRRDSVSAEESVHCEDGYTVHRLTAGPNRGWRRRRSAEA